MVDCFPLGPCRCCVCNGIFCHFDHPGHWHVADGKMALDKALKDLMETTTNPDEPTEKDIIPKLQYRYPK